MGAPRRPHSRIEPADEAAHGLHDLAVGKVPARHLAEHVVGARLAQLRHLIGHVLRRATERARLERVAHAVFMRHLRIVPWIDPRRIDMVVDGIVGGPGMDHVPPRLEEGHPQFVFGLSLAFRHVDEAPHRGVLAPLFPGGGVETAFGKTCLVEIHSFANTRQGNARGHHGRAQAAALAHRAG